MALLDRPDYSFQGQVPTAAIIQAYQQKALAEQKSKQEAEAAKEQQWVDTAKIVQAGADMVTKMTEQSKLRAQEDAFKAATLWAGKKNEIDSSTGATFGESPQYNPTLEAFLAKSNPEEYQKAKIKSMLEGMNPNRSGRDFQLMNYYLKGQQIPTTINYDKTANKGYSLTGQDITASLEGAIPAWAPATVTTNEGVNMVPRIPGQFSATSATPGKGEKITSINQLSPKETEILEKTKEDFNKIAEPLIKKQADLDMVLSAVDTGNWVGDAAILSNAAKGLARDVGALSEPEQVRYMIPPSLIRKVKNRWSVWSKGVIPEKDREDFRAAVAAARRVNDGILSTRIKTFGNQAINRTKRASGMTLDPKFAESYMYEAPETAQSEVPQIGGISIDQNALDAELKKRGL